MKILFISDLHLDPERADIQACFDHFISTCINSNRPHLSIERLYILGDLFELWLGDDASIPVYQQSIRQLKKLVDSGTDIYVMHGNRDFLLASAFEQASGCQLIPDPYTIKIAQHSILLSHGDRFCLDDSDYMHFRKQVRDPVWQQNFLSKSISERIAIAQSLRQQSRQQGQLKSSVITDVNQQAIEQLMTDKEIYLLIHGHTHRPATHKFSINGHLAQRIVLTDWRPDGKAFELDS